MLKFKTGDCVLKVEERNKETNNNISNECRELILKRVKGSFGWL